MPGKTTEARRANGSQLGEMGERIHRRGEVQKKNSQLTRWPVIRIRMERSGPDQIRMMDARIRGVISGRGSPWRQPGPAPGGAVRSAAGWRGFLMRLFKRGRGVKKIAKISAASAPLKRRRCGRCCGAEIGLKAPGRQHEKSAG